MLEFITQRLVARRFLYVLALAFGASAIAIVIVTLGLGAGRENPWGVLPITLAVSVAAALFDRWLTGRRVPRTSTGKGAPRPTSDASPPIYFGKDGEILMLAGLHEQGITVKLLELIALGDRYGNVFSVALVGIDHLNEVNDHYEPAVTEQFLKGVFDVLTHTLRMPDRVGRYQHETFLVILPETPLRGAIQISERLRTAVAELDVAASDRVQIHTTASVGVTSYRRGDDLQSLLERAEKALHQAQISGHNRVLPDLAA